MGAEGGAGVQQAPNHVHVPDRRRLRQRRPPEIVLGIEASLGADQERNQLLLAGARRLVQRRVARVVPGVQVEPERVQLGQRLNGPMTHRRKKQTRVASVGAPQVGTLVRQEPDDGEVAHGGRLVDRRVTPFVGMVHLGPVVHQKQHHLLLPRARRLEQRAVAGMLVDVDELLAMLRQQRRGRHNVPRACRLPEASPGRVGFGRVLVP
mmetsp:Transcript_22138/g.71508  ORF Transcript_22138/g.71508 Transcript_22138/m.71508 type:complete len:208 (-) Transcript_22138:213-836(-)